MYSTSKIREKKVQSGLEMMLIKICRTTVDTYVQRFYSGIDMVIKREYF
jgi:hypothetical protein